MRISQLTTCISWVRKDTYLQRQQSGTKGFTNWPLTKSRRGLNSHHLAASTFLLKLFSEASWHPRPWSLACRISKVTPAVSHVWGQGWRSHPTPGWNCKDMARNTSRGRGWNLSFHLYLRDPESEKLTHKINRPSKGRFLEVTIMYVIFIHISIYLCWAHNLEINQCSPPKQNNKLENIYSYCPL